MNRINLRHIVGLDTIRFTAALWVACAHGAIIPTEREWELHQGIVRHFLWSASALFFNGDAAVMVFFIISGLCIHLPHTGKQRIDLLPYFIRRYVRIAIPLGVIVIVLQIAGGVVKEGSIGALWSVYCELAYYSIYPLLFLLFKNFSVKTITIASFVPVCVILALHPPHLFHWQFGALTWIVCLPTWLLGCLLAEEIAAGAPAIHCSIVWWRIAAWVLTFANLLLITHSPVKIGYPVSMTAFSVFCFFWIAQELQRFTIRPPWQILERSGPWSYSLYLVHPMVIAVVGFVSMGNPAIDGVLRIFAILACSYAFYLIVEAPSHDLARRLTSYVKVVGSSDSSRVGSS